MKTLLQALLLFIVAAFSVQAQVVTTSPAFFTEGQPVTITFDAAQGTAGLKGYTGDVYAHTGVITNKSTSSADWKHVKAAWNVNIPACKMTSLGNDKWQLTISPDIRSFYGITDASETVKQLACFSK